jgi:hypothetical protein
MMPHRHASRLFLISLAALCLGCRNKPKPAPAPPPPPTIQGLPVTMTVKQRSTTAVPGADGKLQLTIDDITGGQVTTTLADSQGSPLIGPVSLRAGSSNDFQFAGQSFTLVFDKLDNALIGEDFATFTIRRPIEAAGKVLTENEKIERLIELVRNSADVRFIRNGTEHTPQEAADHLRAKWQAAGRIATVDEFIEKVASKSSLSGEPYQIRRADGSLMPAGDYLREQLREMK